jgi:hypothetical protein
VIFLGHTASLVVMPAGRGDTERTVASQIRLARPKKLL